MSKQEKYTKDELMKIFNISSSTLNRFIKDHDLSDDSSRTVRNKRQVNEYGQKTYAALAEQYEITEVATEETQDLSADVLQNTIEQQEELIAELRSTNEYLKQLLTNQTRLVDQSQQLQLRLTMDDEKSEDKDGDAVIDHESVEESQDESKVKEDKKSFWQRIKGN